MHSNFRYVIVVSNILTFHVAKFDNITIYANHTSSSYLILVPKKFMIQPFNQNEKSIDAKTYITS